MLKIEIEAGKFLIIDEEDYPLYLRYKPWHFNQGRLYHTINKGEGKNTGNGEYITINLALHRLIVKASDDQFVDHINGNKLDNRKENLRICTCSENKCNSFKVKTMNGNIPSSKYKGVSWHKHSKKWWSKITVNGNPKSLGYYRNEENAAKAYNKAALELHGDFARLNDI